jgi:hypothetical protein
MNNEFKGTKGNWYINECASRNVRCDNGITIASCSSGQSGDLEEEEKYNAKLISKSIEMLEMLKDFENMCDKLQFPTETTLRDMGNKAKQLIHEATNI